MVLNESRAVERSVEGRDRGRDRKAERESERKARRSDDGQLQTRETRKAPVMCYSQSRTPM
jgi:hypothetical protein